LGVDGDIAPEREVARSIALLGEFAAMIACDLNKQGSDRVATLTRGQVLHFQRGKYRLR